MVCRHYRIIGTLHLNKGYFLYCIYLYVVYYLYFHFHDYSFHFLLLNLLVIFL